MSYVVLQYKIKEIVRFVSFSFLQVYEMPLTEKTMSFDFSLKKTEKNNHIRHGCEKYLLLTFITIRHCLSVGLPCISPIRTI